MIWSLLAEARRRQGGSVFQSNYHLMIFCFFVFQEPLVLHAPKILRKEVRVCACTRMCMCILALMLAGRKQDAYVELEDTDSNLKLPNILRVHFFDGGK